MNFFSDTFDKDFLIMAVMTASVKTDSKKQERNETKKHIKYHEKSRPITATLEHPLILDIKLLKKLDMTTFTKKGLIALSKFCGISLINKTDTKKKLNKCVKTIQYSKKQSSGNESGETIAELRNCRSRRKMGKQVAKPRPRIRFKLAKEETSPDEDSRDVVCKKHDGLKSHSTNGDRKSLVESILNATIENVIPEPCKTCSRSEHPERFHSHPKTVMRSSLPEKPGEKNRSGSRHEEGKKSLCANQEKEVPEDKKVPEKLTQSKSSSSVEASPPDSGNKIKSKTPRKPSTTSSSSGKPKKSSSELEANQTGGGKPATGGGGEEEKADDTKFITGCYVCGKQISPKLRLKHEKTCISEWRTQNSLISPDKRKPEPKRPDYRFTASGELDCEGTFESIWANHMDSLVPCKKCGRRFFPDRIERHENCCNNLPLNIKYKH